jgi:hypothetical protein
VVGTGAHSCYIEGRDDEDEHAWDPDERVATGDAACWPGCAVAYVEAKMLEVDKGLVGFD